MNQTSNPKALCVPSPKALCAPSLQVGWKRLIEGESYVLACHVRPDGDCLGAMLALARELRRLGKDVTALSIDGVPENYAFLPGADTVVSRTERRGFDVGILIDSDTPKRVGDSADAVASARTHARIDHHLSSEAFGDICIVDTQISSTCELITQLFEANEIAIDQPTATLLLAGIIFDTGGFRYPNASAGTFEIASELARLGAKSSEIAREVLENRPARALKLLGRALNSLTMEPDASIAYGVITPEDYEELGVTDADTEGIVNSLSAVKGPKVVILFRETEPGTVRVSLRSRDGVDVNQVAKAFDGGGHAAAAGCTVNGTLEEAKSRVIAEVQRWMES